MFEVEVKTKTAKNGNSYTVLEVTFPNGYIKTVFLEQAEQFIVREL